MSFYVLDENNNKVEAFDKQGVLALLDQAIKEGKLDAITADSAFINKIKCCVSGGTFNIAFVTEAQYNALKAADQLIVNTYYYIVDDTSYNDILDFIREENEFNEGILERLNNIDNKIAHNFKTLTMGYIRSAAVELELNATYIFAIGGLTFTLVTASYQTTGDQTFYSSLCAHELGNAHFRLRYVLNASGSGSTLYLEVNNPALHNDFKVVENEDTTNFINVNYYKN